MIPMSNSDARKRLAERANTDLCQTPGCGHETGNHLGRGTGSCGAVGCPCTRYTASECTCPPDEFLSPSDCALHGDEVPNQFRHSNGEELGMPANLTAPTETVSERTECFIEGCDRTPVAGRGCKHHVRESVLADAEAAWDRWIQERPINASEWAAFKFAYLAGKGIDQ